MCSLSLNLIFVTYIAILFFFFFFFFFSPGTVIATAYPFLKECQNVVKQVNLLTHIIAKMITTIIIDLIKLITQSLSCVSLMMYSVCAQLKGTAQGA